MFHSIRVRVRLAHTTAWTETEAIDCIRRLVQFEPALLVDVPPEDVAFRHAACVEGLATSCRFHVQCWSSALANHAPAIAMLVVPSVEAAAAVTAQLYDAGSIVVLELPSTDPPPALPPGAWTCRSAGTPEPVAFTVDRAGHAVRTDRSGAQRSTSAPIWALSVEEIRAQLELEPAPDDALATLPIRDPLTLPDGRVWRRYTWAGGTMAMGHARTQAEAMAALGFDDEEAFRKWARELQRGEPSAEHDFPSFVSPVPFGGTFVDHEGVVSARSAPKLTGRVVLAGLLATGDFETARAMIGLGASHFDRADRVALDQLGADELATLLASSRGALAEALFVLARSRLPRPKRAAVAMLLPLLGIEKARVLARTIEAEEPDIGGAAAKAFGHAATRRRLARPRTDTTSVRRYLDEVLAKLEEIFGGAK